MDMQVAFITNEMKLLAFQLWFPIRKFSGMSVENSYLYRLTTAFDGTDFSQVNLLVSFHYTDPLSSLNPHRRPFKKTDLLLWASVSEASLAFQR